MASNTGQVAPRPLTVDEGIIAARLDNDVCKARDGRLPVFHPDGTQIGSITAAGPEMIEAAVNRARWVFENSGWPTAASSERARLLRQFAAAIESDREVLALRDTLDMGRPIGRTYSDVDSAASLLRMAADTVDSESEHVWPDGLVTAPSAAAFRLESSQRSPRGTIRSSSPSPKSQRRSLPATLLSSSPLSWRRILLSAWCNLRNRRGYRPAYCQSSRVPGRLARPSQRTRRSRS